MRTAIQRQNNKHSLSSLEQNIPEICQEWLNNDPLFLDTETTGLGERAEIVELAVVNGDGKVLINTLIKPSSPIPAVVTELHGINNETVANAPDWHDIYPEVRSLLTGRRVIADNARFDARMLEQTCGFYRLLRPRIIRNRAKAGSLYRFFQVQEPFSMQWCSPILI